MRLPKVHLVYEAVDQLTRRGIVQSTCVGVGDYSLIVTTQPLVIETVNAHTDMLASVLICEIGATAETEASQ